MSKEAKVENKEPNVEALMKSIDADLDEIATLAKSVLGPEIMNKTDDNDADDMPSSEEMGGDDAAKDLVHEADHGADVGSLVEYAKGLSEEELQAILEALMDEFEARDGGMGDDTGLEEEAPEIEQPPQEGEEIEEGQELEDPMAEEPVDKMGDLPMSDPMIDPMLGKEGDLPPEMDEGEMSMDAAPPGDDMGMEPDAPMSPEELMAAVSELDSEELGRLKAAIDQAMGGMAQKSLKLPSVSGEDKDADGGEMGTLKKSVEELTSMVKALKASNAELLKKSQAPKVVKVPSAVVTKKYADTDKDVRVLEKSEPVSKKMNGMELANWLINEQRNGNRKVKSLMVTQANVAKSEEEVDEICKNLKALGIELPV